MRPVPSEAGVALPRGDDRDARPCHRTFVAVTLAPALRESAASARTVFGPAAARLRWVPQRNLHLTLRFLGEITETQVARVTEAAREAGASASPFSITVGGVGAFPSPRSPRVVWVGVTAGADRLVALAGVLEAALRQREFPAEARPFQPHLTVARARPEGRPPDVSAILSGEAAETFVAGTETVGALVVMESRLRPSGAVYEEVARVPLGVG